MAIYDRISHVEFELNTICQSYCPICIRYTAVGVVNAETGKKEDQLFLNPNARLNEVLDFELIEKIFSDPLIADRVRVDMIGTAGEPVAHPRFLEIVKKIIELKPNANFNIHTNGGVRNEKFFTALGEILPSGSRVCFSLDGLEDTNHIYRINVDWNKCIKNLKAFIATGARATWQMVLFDWNKHQLDDVRNYAIELGCDEFETRENVDAEGIQKALDAATTKINNIPAPSKTTNKPYPTAPIVDIINDQCFSKRNIFVSSNGKVYPCCMFPAASFDKVFKKFFHEAMEIDTYGDEWNDLKNHTVTEIMEHQWWIDLKKQINMEIDPCFICKHECGSSDEWNAHADINEKSYQLK
ncbi:radical SAM protein [bacterium]|nr:radical SAM protein [bacterium]MDB4128512.1 radical SAM protein [bacterium]MDC1257287.1 radical SAM protein [bacterium]